MAQATIYPHEVGRDLIPELATRVYSSQLDSFREAISNAFDEGSRQVSLTITKDRIVIEDWGGGIKDYDEFRRFGQASKKSRTGETIGEKGLGKLSLLNLGSLVQFETNNGSAGFMFHMTMAGFSRPEFGDRAGSFVQHRGTRITITGLANEVDIADVSSYLRKTFGLRLVHGASISINGQRLKPRFAHNAEEIMLFKLPKCGADVTGNIRFSEDGKGAIDVYIDHVFVTSMEVDTARKFEGWANCSALTPETSRNNVVQDQIFREFAILLRKYASRFPLREIGTDEHKLMLSKELNGLLKGYLKDMKVNVKSGFSISSAIIRPDDDGSDKSRAVAAKVRAGSKQQLAKKPSSSENRQSAAATVKWQYADLGNEKEPIYFVPPNTIYCNTSSDLYRFAVEKNRYYGPTWIRILPYLSRIAVSMVSGSSRLRPDEFNQKVDQATLYFLRRKKIIK